MHFAPAFRRTALASSLKLALSAIVLGAPILLTPTVTHAQAQTRAYDIPGGPLGDVLGRYGREAGIMLSFRPELTEGRQSSGLKGSYSIGGGLDALLAGTGLRAVLQANGSYVLNSLPGAGAGANVLPTVTVTAATAADLPPAYAGGQVARGGGLGMLGTSDVMDIPFSTTNYTSQALEDQQARTLADVVVNEASVRVLTSSSGFSDDFQIRGFSMSSDDVGLNGLFGLASSNRMPAAIMERVEVLKGPGTLMNGIGPANSVGGGINIVTKRAGDEPLTRLTTTYESKSVLGIHADVGRRFGEQNRWGLRVNSVYRNGQTSLDNGRQEFGLGAFALDYRGARLRWSLDAYTQRENTDNFRSQNGFQTGSRVIPDAPSGHRAIYNGTELMFRDSTIASRLEYDLSDKVTVYAAGGYRYGASEQDFPAARSASAVSPTGDLRVTNAWYDAYSRTKTGEIGARTRFSTWGVKHALNLSASRLEQEKGNFFLSAPPASAQPSNIYHPVKLTPMTGERHRPGKASEATLSSIAVTDTLSFLDDRVLLTGGLRHQRVEMDAFNTSTGLRTSSYSGSTVTPLVGFVVKPLANVSVYGNYTAGLTTGSVATEPADNAGESFPPAKTKQYEAGVKADWGPAMTTVSIFQIERPNAYTDTTTNLYSYGGEQRNRGLELAAVGEVVDGVRVMASATFYDAKQTKTNGGLNQGNKAVGVPDHTLNLGVGWDLPWVPGLNLNARAIHTAKVQLDAANTIQMPSWTRYDVGARYVTEVAGRSVVFRANVENVFNSNYWLASGSFATVAAPRTVLLSAQIDF
ncbi:Ferrichrome-iron receptor [plant metagenome]|uniref:Ferrichrome-iron receptor n=1 Tax=plant metagenome TaxID=1297885 RepID=A0A484R430_9ZZZZ